MGREAHHCLTRHSRRGLWPRRAQPKVNPMAFLAGWKTHIFNALVIVLGIVTALDPALVTQAFGFGPRGTAIVLCVIGLCGMVLREITKGPARKKLE